MLCLRRAKGGERISTQNVLGSRETDLLRITDWFFPKGIDHHHLMAGVPGVRDVMQSFARKLAGIGRLPAEAAPPRPAARVACDVLVVGAGLSGAIVASALSRRGFDVHLVDDGAEPGGAARAAGHRATEMLSQHSLDEVHVHLESTVVGVYDGEAVVATPAQGLVLEPRAIVVATGAHDGAVAVENNDLPGVMSARAIAVLASYGVVPNAPTVVVGEGPWAERVKDLAGAHLAAVLTEADLASIEGTSSVTGVRKKDGSRVKAKLVALALPGAPSFELAESMGASVDHGPEGYRIVTAENGRATDRAWAVGECTGAPFDPRALADAAIACADDVARALG
jgi:sarcosine oxidase subunit alpha